LAFAARIGAPPPLPLPLRLADNQAHRLSRMTCAPSHDCSIAHFRDFESDERIKKGLTAIASIRSKRAHFMS